MDWLSRGFGREDPRRKSGLRHPAEHPAPRRVPAAAKRDAAAAKATADQANATANATSEKLDRMFKKSMNK